MTCWYGFRIFSRKENNGKKKKKKKTFDRATEQRFANSKSKRSVRRRKKMQAENEAKLLKILLGASDQVESSVAGSNVGKYSLQANALKAASGQCNARSG